VQERLVSPGSFGFPAAGDSSGAGAFDTQARLALGSEGIRIRILDDAMRS
jgi:hypothetical protein